MDPGEQAPGVCDEEKGSSSEQKAGRNQRVYAGAAGDEASHGRQAEARRESTALTALQRGRSSLRGAPWATPQHRPPRDSEDDSAALLSQIQHHTHQPEAHSRTGVCSEPGSMGDRGRLGRCTGVGEG